MSETFRTIHTDELEIVDNSGFGSLFEHVEIDICAETSKTSFRIDGISSHNRSKSFTLWLPSKCDNGILDLNNFDGNILLSYMEDLQVGERSFLRFGMAIDFDT